MSAHDAEVSGEQTKTETESKSAEGGSENEAAEGTATSNVSFCSS